MRKEKIQNLTIASSIIIYNFKLAAESDDDHYCHHELVCSHSTYIRLV